MSYVWWWGKVQSVYSDQITLRWNVRQIAGRFPAEQKIYPTDPFNAYWKLFPGVERWGLVLTIHPQLVSWLRMCGATPPLCHITSCHAVGHLYLYMVQTLQLSDLLYIKNLLQNTLMWYKVYIRHSPINKRALQNVIITQTFWKGSKV